MMKKFWMTLIILSVFFSGLLIAADREEENWQKARQEAIEEAELKLGSLGEMIHNTLPDDISIDRKITPDEMATWSIYMAAFMNRERYFSERLKLYSAEKVVEHFTIDPEYKAAVKTFYGSTVIDGDNAQEDVRAFFAKKTGRDVKVGGEFNFVDAMCLGFSGFSLYYGVKPNMHHRIMFSATLPFDLGVAYGVNNLFNKKASLKSKIISTSIGVGSGYTLIHFMKSFGKHGRYTGDTKTEICLRASSLLISAAFYYLTKLPNGGGRNQEKLYKKLTK